MIDKDHLERVHIAAQVRGDKPVRDEYIIEAYDLFIKGDERAEDPHQKFITLESIYRLALALQETRFK